MIGSIEFLPLITYVCVSTFSPGPNNISSASMGITYGYIRTLRYLAGITCGVFFLMLVCASFSSTLLSLLPSLENTMRWIGSAYITWLAFSILSADFNPGDINKEQAAFSKGLFLQLLNPKAIIFGMTIYSTFLASLSGNVSMLVVSALIFALTTFVAVSCWALFGAAVRTKLTNPVFSRALNRVLALLLVYTALELSGVFGF